MLQKQQVAPKQNKKQQQNGTMVNHLSLIGQNFLASAVGTG